MWRYLFIFLTLFSILPQSVHAEQENIKIGVLSHRGYEATLSSWSPTANYLSNAIEGYQFEIIPLNFAEVSPAVEFGQVDFILVNPGIYVNLEVRYRISRISTLNNRVGASANNVFGGVMFVSKKRTDISTFDDLKGKSFMAVDETSLGGFQMAWRELKANGINPYEDFSSLTFGGIHDDVVRAVLNHKVDVGTVRTDILERMSIAGQIRMDDFTILNKKLNPEFLFSRSTRLYPEWPISKVRHTTNELAQKVAVALLNMPKGHVAAQAGNYLGWTIPLDYQPVHELFKELHLPPYKEPGKFTLLDATRKYWYLFAGGLVFLVSMIFMTSWVFRLNRALQKAKTHLERQYELIVNSVADGIVGVDMDGRTTFANRAMNRITGWHEDDLIGARLHKVIHHTHADGNKHPANQCPVYLTYKNSVSQFIDDDVFWKKDGTSFPVEYTSTPIKNHQDETVGSVVVFRDISEQKKAEEEARQHQADLAHVARLSTMGEMASGIAHEINQPLTAIATNAHACLRMMEQNENETEKVMDVLERIGSQAERAGEIIRQLRQFVKKESPGLSQIDINEVINEVVLLLKTEIARADVRIKLNLATDLGTVMALHVQIDQVLLNLARNAIEAMMDIPVENRLLEISSFREGEKHVAVTVSDSGPGLNPALVDTLFNPFVTTKPNGMGLGLSISHGIIEAHKGQIMLDSAVTRGAKFKFVLPVEQQEI